MKRICYLAVFIMGMFWFIPTSDATSGCCSSHGGVDCSRIQSDGTVVCNDGWLGSTCSYNSMAKCSSSNPSTIGSHVQSTTIYGCTDPSAKNYNPSANRDNGSCVKKITGCTDPYAYNYNPSANTDDGSCMDKVMGCINKDAVNYNAKANVDDGSCIAKIMGCTNSKAKNYNAKANVDDGSCIAKVSGCTDSKATNYNSKANTNDGSCLYDNESSKNEPITDKSEKASTDDVGGNVATGILGTLGGFAWVIIKKIKPKIV